MKQININNLELLKSWPFLEAIKVIDNFAGLNNFRKPK